MQLTAQVLRNELAKTRRKYIQNIGKHERATNMPYLRKYAKNTRN